MKSYKLLAKKTVSVDEGNGDIYAYNCNGGYVDIYTVEVNGKKMDITCEGRYLHEKTNDSEETFRCKGLHSSRLGTLLNMMKKRSLI